MALKNKVNIFGILFILVNMGYVSRGFCEPIPIKFLVRGPKCLDRIKKFAPKYYDPSAIECFLGKIEYEENTYYPILVKLENTVGKGRSTVALGTYMLLKAHGKKPLLASLSRFTNNSSLCFSSDFAVLEFPNGNWNQGQFIWTEFGGKERAIQFLTQVESGEVISSKESEDATEADIALELARFDEESD